MKRLGLRSTLLFILPVAALVALPFMLAGRASQKSQGYSTQVIALAPGLGKNWHGQRLPHAPDTELHVTLTYSPPSVGKRLKHPSFQLRNIQLVDQKGRQHKFLITNAINPGAQLWHQDWIFTFPLPLRLIPKSAGKVTFKADLAIDHGPWVPVSVVVRNAA